MFATLFYSTARAVGEFCTGRREVAAAAREVAWHSSANQQIAAGAVPARKTATPSVVVATVETSYLAPVRAGTRELSAADAIVLDLQSSGALARGLALNAALRFAATATASLESRQRVVFTGLGVARDLNATAMITRFEAAAKTLHP